MCMAILCCPNLFLLLPRLRPECLQRPRCQPQQVIQAPHRSPQRPGICSRVVSACTGGFSVLCVSHYALQLMIRSMHADGSGNAYITSVLPSTVSDLVTCFGRSCRVRVACQCGYDHDSSIQSSHRGRQDLHLWIDRKCVANHGGVPVAGVHMRSAAAQHSKMAEDMPFDSCDYWHARAGGSQGVWLLWIYFLSPTGAHTGWCFGSD